MNRGQVRPGADEKKIIILCEGCSQKLRLPQRQKKLRVTCPTCRHQFDFRYYGLGFSSNSKKPLLISLAGSLAGFAIVELIETSQVLPPTSAFNALLAAVLAMGVFGACLGAALGAADGLFRKTRTRLYYGLGVGALLGLVSGAVAGLVAQIIFAALLPSEAAGSQPDFAQLMFARVIGWCVLGLLIGLSYGIKENTSGDVKFGLMGGAIGGALGGFFFDPLSSLIQMGDGTLGRLAAFSVLGVAIGVAINHLREAAIASNRPEMYQPLTRRLPANPRLMLPPPNIKNQ